MYVGRLVFFKSDEARGVQALPIEPWLVAESSEAARLAAEYLEALREDRWRAARRVTALWRPERQELLVLRRGRWAPPAARFDHSRLYFLQAAALQATAPPGELRCQPVTELMVPALRPCSAGGGAYSAPLGS